MTQSVGVRERRYSIPVWTALKVDESFAYSATDIIEDLNVWIDHYLGIPCAQQRVVVGYGCSKFWEKKELRNCSHESLIDVLQGARYVQVFLKSRQGS